MLHLITEVGKPGVHDFEKRHFPSLDNRPGQPVYKPRGRRYIPHGHGAEYKFVPHPPMQDPRYTEHGLDWKSRIRRIPSPHNPDYKPEIWPDPWFSLRTYPGSKSRSSKEWMMYPELPGYDATLRCKWDDQHLASQHGEVEISHTELYGKGRNFAVIDKRNGLSQASPGDKSYQAVEYSPKFYKYGSTLPIVNFGGNAKPQADTFVPLEPSTYSYSNSFKKKEEAQRLQKEVSEVRRLDMWRPATPLQPPPQNN